jgi:hypothetical protein
MAKVMYLRQIQTSRERHAIPCAGRTRLPVFILRHPKKEMKVTMVHSTLAPNLPLK